MAKTPHCKSCNRDGHYAISCRYTKRKAIRKKGKVTLEYEQWRDEVAKPYLDKTFGHVCAGCGGSRCGNKQLDVDHIQNRGSHPTLRRNLNNVQYLGRIPCHQEKTIGVIDEDDVDDYFDD